MKASRLATLLVLASLAPGAALSPAAVQAPHRVPVQALERVPIRTPPRLVIEAPPALAPVAARIRAIDPARLAAPMELVGLTDAGPPIQVYLAPEGSELARYVPRWVAGYSFGERGVIVLLPARTPSYPDSSLEEVLRHEVAHVLIARAAGGHEVPRWFHEGVAMIAGSSWGIGDRTRLTLALIENDEVSLAELDARFQSGDDGQVARAYALAGAFVNDLFDRYGRGVAADVLAGVARGLPFADAFARATGSSPSAAETSFLRRQSIWYRWVPLATSSVTVWAAITLLALWAGRHRRRRDAALFARWDEEERRAVAVAADDEPVN